MTYVVSVKHGYDDNQPWMSQSVDRGLAKGKQYETDVLVHLRITLRREMILYSAWYSGALLQERGVVSALSRWTKKDEEDEKNRVGSTIRCDTSCISHRITSHLTADGVKVGIQINIIRNRY